MTTPTEDQQKHYGLFTFARLYARWLNQRDGPRYFIAPDLRPEEANALAASYAFFLAISLLMCVLLPVEYFLGETEGIWVLVGLLGLCLASFAYISRTGKSTVPVLFTAVYVDFMCAYYLWVGQVDSNSILFYFWVVPVLVICLNARLGNVLSLVFIAMLSLLFVPPLNDCLAATLTPGFRFRFILAMICIFLVSSLAEYYLCVMFRSIFAISRELEQYSLTDSLTGQGNRRNFLNQFQRLHALQLRSDAPFTLVMADLDHFKRVNDTYGHMIGDAVLAFVAETLARTLRRQDSLYRWGGEEFFVLLPGADLGQGKVAAERMRKTLEEAVFSRDGLNLTITASFGVYTVGTARPMHEHIRNTDALLYQAKAAGRNRVAAADGRAGVATGLAPANPPADL